MSFSEDDLRKIIKLTNNDEKSFTVSIHQEFKRIINNKFGSTIVRNLREFLEKINGPTLVLLQNILKCSHPTFHSIYEHLRDTHVKKNFAKICDTPGSTNTSSSTISLLKASSSTSKTSTSTSTSKPSTSISKSSTSTSASPARITVTLPSGPFIAMRGGGIPFLPHHPIVNARSFGMPMIGGPAGVLVHKNGQVFHGAVSVGGGRFAIPTSSGMALIEC
jgi:hypothetical protein